MLFQIQDRIVQSGTKRSRAEQGFMVIRDCRLARSGILEYTAANFQPRAFNDRKPLDVIRVYRPVEEVDNAAASFSGAPLTNNHPTEMLDTRNTNNYQVGHVNGNVSVQDIDGDRVMVADIIVTDERTIKDIENGKQELSNGYYSQYEFESGITPDGQEYDCIQVGLRANHVALVDQGRCGFECRVSDSKNANTGDKPMATVTIGGVSYEASEQVAQAVGVLQANLDAANKKLEDQPSLDSAVTAAVDTAKAEAQATIDGLQGKVDALESEKVTPEQINVMVNDRMDTIATAKKFDSKFEAGEMDTAEIKGKVVLAQCADIDTLDGKSEEYIAARFDGLKAQSPNSLASAMREHLNNDSADDVENVVLDAKERRSKRFADNFKQK